MSTEKLPRRDFLILAWQGMAILATAGTGYMGLRFLASRVGEGIFGGVVVAGKLEDFLPGTITPVTEGQFYLAHLTDGRLLALYRKCPHLGCVVLWNKHDEHFICPCHGSLFEVDGDVINPPAPHSLDQFLVTVEDGIVRVDTSQRIERG